MHRPKTSFQGRNRACWELTQYLGWTRARHCGFHIGHLEYHAGGHYVSSRSAEMAFIHSNGDRYFLNIEISHIKILAGDATSLASP